VDSGLVLASAILSGGIHLCLRPLSVDQPSPMAMAMIIDFILSPWICLVAPVVLGHDARGKEVIDDTLFLSKKVEGRLDRCGGFLTKIIFSPM